MFALEASIVLEVKYVTLFVTSVKRLERREASPSKVISLGMGS
jgi:hypothetical protein